MNKEIPQDLPEEEIRIEPVIIPMTPLAFYQLIAEAKRQIILDRWERQHPKPKVRGGQ